MNFTNILLNVIVGLLLIISTTMAHENRMAKANNQFGMDLFKSVAKGDNNKLISPFSAHVVLSMAYQGTDGETLADMANVFHLSDPTSTANEYHKIVRQLAKVKSVTLNIANKIYVQENFHLNPDFKNIIESKYLSEAEEINFNQNVKAAGEINAWVKNKTNSKINELIKPDMLDSFTRLVLLNAVYFKGNWASKFNPEDTSKKPFYLLNGKEIKVDMMSKSSKFFYRDAEELDCKILELPYEGKELSMVIFLPNQRNGVNKLQEKLATVDLSEVVQQLGQFTVNVEIPKFKIESTIPMKDALIELGAANMFSDDANFSKMADEGLKVSSVIQKTFIEVNEEGSEAAAATGMMMMTRCMPMPIRLVNFKADYPFIFVLTHKDEDSKTVLFLGKVVEP